MAVKIGSARIDERGKATGGAAGDQTGNEVGTQNWYNHSKGWRVFRAIDPAAGPKMAKCMKMACDNSKIGYDQNQRNTLYTAAKPYNFDVSKVTTKVETDCSALTRVCAAYAGIMLSDYNTASEPSVLLKSGKFKELTGSKYTSKSDYLRAGDILVTKTKGHTVIVISDGPKANSNADEKPIVYKLGDRILVNGMEGDDVKELQRLLVALDYSVGSYGIDGEFGDATEIAVKKFQKDYKLDADGEAGPLTIEALLKAQGEDDAPVVSGKVKIVGGNCYIRTAGNTSAKALDIAYQGSKYDYAGEQTPEGWIAIMYNGTKTWVSGKYGKIV